MGRNKRKQIERVLSESRAPESLKASFWRAYWAAHKSIKGRSKLAGGV